MKLDGRIADGMKLDGRIADGMKLHGRMADGMQLDGCKQLHYLLLTSLFYEIKYFFCLVYIYSLTFIPLAHHRRPSTTSKFVHLQHYYREFLFCGIGLLSICHGPRVPDNVIVNVKFCLCLTFMISFVIFTVIIFLICFPLFGLSFWTALILSIHSIEDVCTSLNVDLLPLQLGCWLLFSWLVCGDKLATLRWLWEDVQCTMHFVNTISC